MSWAWPQYIIIVLLLLRALGQAYLWGANKHVEPNAATVIHPLIMGFILWWGGFFS